MAIAQQASAVTEDRDRLTAATPSAKCVTTGGIRTCVPAVRSRGEATAPSHDGDDPEWNVVRGID